MNSASWILMTVALLSGHLMTTRAVVWGDAGTCEPAGASRDTMGISEVV